MLIEAESIAVLKDDISRSFKGRIERSFDTLPKEVKVM